LKKLKILNLYNVFRKLVKVDNVPFVVQKMLIVSQFLITLYGIEIPNFNFGNQVAMNRVVKLSYF